MLLNVSTNSYYSQVTNLGVTIVRTHTYLFQHLQIYTCNIIWSTRNTCSEPRLSVTTTKYFGKRTSSEHSTTDEEHEIHHDDVQTQLLVSAPPVLLSDSES